MERNYEEENEYISSHLIHFGGCRRSDFWL